MDSSINGPALCGENEEDWTDTDVHKLIMLVDGWAFELSDWDVQNPPSTVV